MSGAKPRFAFFLETEGQPIDGGHSAWNRNLPGSPGCFSGGERAGEEIPFTVGDYFLTAREFLKSAAPTASAERIRIHLAKHGPFYHPARVAAELKGRRAEFVLNMAVSEAGRQLIHREYATLQRLNRTVAPSYLPAVFAVGEAALPGKPQVPMFIGQWLAGFCEFHLSRSSKAAETGMVVWDPDDGDRRLDRDQTRAVYREATRILAHYFNFATGECIGSWNHAAGDFVVNLAGPGPQVRLITVRDYRPLLRPAADAGRGLPALMETLLVFFLDTTIRMRLDRLDGVGEIAWAGPVAVEGGLEGFLAALSEKPEPAGVPLPLDLLFRHYALACSPDHLLELCRGLLGRLLPGTGAPPVAAAGLEEHVDLLASSLADG
ncbi:MAG: hypothetical protein MUD16_01145 [Desulfobacterales bacterium]|nr:hypothetical protein [Desulfobacterales bacterium]